MSSSAGTTGTRGLASLQSEASVWGLSDGQIASLAEDQEKDFNMKIHRDDDAVWNLLIGEPSDEAAKTLSRLSFPKEWANEGGFDENLKVLVRSGVLNSTHRYRHSGKPPLGEVKAAFHKPDWLLLLPKGAGPEERLPDSLSMGDLWLTLPPLWESPRNEPMVPRPAPFVGVPFELKEQTTTTRVSQSEMDRQICDTLLIMLSQVGRAYALGVTIGNEQARLFCASSLGIIVSPYIHTKKDQARFLHLLVTLTKLSTEQFGFSFASPYSFPFSLSLDSSKFRHTSFDDTNATDERSSSITMTKLLVGRVRIVGRGVSGFEAEINGKRAFLKSTFTDVKRLKAESTALGKIGERPHRNLLHVQKTWESVSSPFPVPSTHSDRWVDRRHCIHVVTPLGRPLWDLRDLRTRRQDKSKNLAKVFLDLIEGHRHLHQLGFLHRDVSVQNCMFYHDEGGQLQGLLIDYDYSLDLDGERGGTPRGGERTGTMPFLSRNLLGIKPEMIEPHSVADDLESFFYVLLWIVLHGGKEGTPKNVEAAGVLRAWNNGGIVAQTLKMAPQRSDVLLTWANAGMVPSDYELIFRGFADRFQSEVFIENVDNHKQLLARLNGAYKGMR